MYQILNKEESERLRKISSKLHGAEYLSVDLKVILEELSFLLDIQNAIIFVNQDKINHKEFIGDAKEYWKKYSKEIKDKIEKSRIMGEYSITINLTEEIKRLLVVPIEDHDEIIGFLVVINKRIDYGNDEHNTKIVEILKKQIKYVIKKYKERGELFNLFGKYVDKRQIAKIIDDPNFLKTPEMIESVVLFADIAGFTKLSNEMEVKELFEFLSNVFYEMTKCINRNNGIVDKLVGDQIIGIFGLLSPKTRTIDSIKSAIEMQKIFNEKFKEYNVGLKIGIVKSHMLYGHLGGNYKSDLTVIGAGVNLASRLCSYAKSNEILVNKLIYKKLFKLYNFEKVGYRKLKGFKKRQLIYSLKS